MLPDTGERYLSTPLFANTPADMTPEEIERWLAPILNYIPTREARPEADEPDVAELPLAKHPPGCACAMHMRLAMKPRAEVSPN